MAALSVNMWGCAKSTNTQSATEENIELVEPANSAVTVEKAAYRNLYDVKTTAATVMPYIEEYATEEYGMVLDHFCAFPGQEVTAGQVLCYFDTENIDNQIKDMQQRIADLDESHEEYVENMNEQLEIKKRALNNLQGYMDAYNRAPETYDQEVANVQLLGPYKTTEHAINTMELNMAQQEELYNLDRSYYVQQMNNLKNKKNKCHINSKISGTVVGIAQINAGSGVQSDKKIIAVGDPSQLILKCDYISTSEVKKCSDVYAMVNGKRIEVEFKPIDKEEYTRLTGAGETVYSSFEIKGETEGIEVGDLAVIVMVKDQRENVLSVPKSAVSKDELGNFVYVVENNTRNQTYIKTGMSDGAYVEVLSGVEEGDEIFVETAPKTGKKTAKLAKGEFSGSYEGMGAITYPSTKVIYNEVENGTLYFKSTDLSRFQYVNSGDVLYNVYVTGDNVALERNQTRRNRLAERLEDLTKKKSNGETYGSKKEIEAKQEELAELDKTIAKQKADFATKTIKTDISGVIAYFPQFEEEQIIPKGEVLALIASEGICYIMAKNENQQLQLGDDVTIHVDDWNSNSFSVDGKVVSASALGLSADLASDRACVAVAKEDVEKISNVGFNYMNWGDNDRYKVTAKIRKTENVVVVPAKAVSSINGCTYVSVKLTSGEIVNQSFVAGGFNSDYYWVVDGLTEGMEVCLE